MSVGMLRTGPRVAGTISHTARHLTLRAAARREQSGGRCVCSPAMATVACGRLMCADGDLLGENGHARFLAAGP